MINLEHLTEEERNIILDVLRRDEALRQAEQDRVKKLKNELHELRKKAAVKIDDGSVSASSSSPSNKNVCARCREPLGSLFGSGEVCSRCQHKVCNNCKVFLPSGKKWLCTVCNKQFQIRLGTGGIPGLKQEEDKEALYGSELVRASLTQTTPKGNQQEPKVIVTSGPTSPADSGYNGRRANISSMGESTEASTTTYDDEYPSDASYDHSAASGVESIGPSVSQRGGVVRHNEDGTLTRNDAGKHYVSDSENEVSLDLARTAEITLEPVSAADIAGNHTTYHSDNDEVDASLQDIKCNASDSGIESIHNGQTEGGETERLTPSLPQSFAPLVDTVTNVQYPTTNARYRTSVSLQIRSVGTNFPNQSDSQIKESAFHSRDGKFFQPPIDDCGMMPQHSDSIHPLPCHATHRKDRVSRSQQTQVPLSVQTTPSVFIPPELTHGVSDPSRNNRFTPLTSNNIGSPRSTLPTTNTDHLYTHRNSPTTTTSNFDKFDRADIEGLDRFTYVACSSDDVDEDSLGKFSDPFGDDSSRVSDLETMSITSCSTLTWDAMPDQTESNIDHKFDTSDGADDKTPTDTDYDGRSFISHNVDMNTPVRDCATEPGIQPTMSLCYESVSSMSYPSVHMNSCASSHVFYSPKDVTMSEDPTSSLCDTPFPAVVSSSVVDSNVIQHTTEEFDNDVDHIGTLPTDMNGSNGNNNQVVLADKREKIHPSDRKQMEHSDHVVKGNQISTRRNPSYGSEFSVSDILFFQQQGTNLHEEYKRTSSCSDVNPPAVTSKKPEAKDNDVLRNPEGESKYATSNHGSRSAHVTSVKWTDMGSINSHYIDYESDESDVSSIDFSQLNFSDSESDKGNATNTGQQKGKKLLEFSANLADFIDEFKEETNDSIAQVVLDGKSEPLVPLVLPTALREGLEAGRDDKDKQDSLFFPSPFFRRLVGTPRTPTPTSSLTYSSNVSSSSDVSSGSESVDELFLDLDPALQTYSEDEKELLLKNKLDMNENLMKSLLGELQASEATQSSPESRKDDTSPSTSGSVAQHQLDDDEKESTPKSHKLKLKKRGNKKKENGSNQRDGSSEGRVKKRSKKKAKQTPEGDSENESPTKSGKRKSKPGKLKSESGDNSNKNSSKKHEMKQSRTEFGLLEKSSDGRSQTYHFVAEEEEEVHNVVEDITKSDLGGGRSKRSSKKGKTKQSRIEFGVLQKSSDGKSQTYHLDTQEEVIDDILDENSNLGHGGARNKHSSKKGREKQPRAEFNVSEKASDGSSPTYRAVAEEVNDKADDRGRRPVPLPDNQDYLAQTGADLQKVGRPLSPYVSRAVPPPLRNQKKSASNCNRSNSKHSQSMKEEIVSRPLTPQVTHSLPQPQVRRKPPSPSPTTTPTLIAGADKRNSETSPWKDKLQFNFEIPDKQYDTLSPSRDDEDEVDCRTSFRSWRFDAPRTPPVELNNSSDSELSVIQEEPEEEEELES